MPTVTCPYCQLQSLSKFAHKAHLRSAHATLFNNNIRTSITGASHELVTESRVEPVQPAASCGSPTPSVSVPGTDGGTVVTTDQPVGLVVDELVGANFEDLYLYMDVRIGGVLFRLRFDRNHFNIG